ncbi:MAG TPA: hypothetical protein VFL36_10380 [Myxococcales bacterium]|nr:hypothetical protein [Myxococcales bacterium]
MNFKLQHRWSPHRYLLVGGSVAVAAGVFIVIAILWSMRVQFAPGGRRDYFPPAGDRRLPDHWADFGANIFAKELESAGEVPWWRGQAGLEAYRFTWDRSFDPLLIVRVERTHRGARVVWHESEGSADGGAHLLSGEREVAKEEWEAIDGLFEKARFWQSPESDLPSGGKDGADWLVEGVRGETYQLWTAWAPLRRSASLDALARAALALVKVAERMPAADRVY